jgi:anti-sigma B factor antagonist
VSPLSVTLHRQDPAAAVVALLGEHDAYTAARLENELALLLGEGVHLVIDLTEATFVDSHTLSVLLSARHQAEAADLGFVVVVSEGDSTQVHRILAMTGLDAAFAICPSVARALEATRAGSNAGDRLRVA